MDDITDQLPADIDALQALVAAARAERDAAIAERDHALSQMDRLRHLLRQLGRVRLEFQRPSNCFARRYRLSFERIAI